VKGSIARSSVVRWHASFRSSHRSASLPQEHFVVRVDRFAPSPQTFPSISLSGLSTVALAIRSLQLLQVGWPQPKAGWGQVLSWVTIPGSIVDLHRYKHGKSWKE